jgi:hypothetical protein
MAAPWTTCTPEKVLEICALLEQGEPLAVICRRAGMPRVRTVYDWQAADPDVQDMFQQARDIGEEAIAADCLVIADDAGGDYRAGDKSPLVDSDHIQRSRLRVDTRLKLLAKWNPRRWGDRHALEHSGPDGKPLQIAATNLLTDEQLGEVINKG